MLFIVEMRRSEYDAFDGVLVHLEYETLEDAAAAVELLSGDPTVARGIAIIRVTVTAATIAHAIPGVTFTPVS